jgi:hypothetical protein
MNKYIVETHLGAFETFAVSPAKALSNIRWRLFGRCGYVKTDYWTIKAIETTNTKSKRA